MMRMALCLLFACATACRSHPPAAQDASAALNGDSARVTRLEQSMLQALTGRDSVGLDSLLDSTFVFEGPGPARPPQGRRGFLTEALETARAVGPVQFGRFEQIGDSADQALALSYRPAFGREGGGRADVYWVDRWVRQGATWRLARRQEVPQ